eukprot:253456-Rhodomonas_salina.3
MLSSASNESKLEALCQLVLSFEQELAPCFPDLALLDVPAPSDWRTAERTLVLKLHSLDNNEWGWQCLETVLAVLARRSALTVNEVLFCTLHSAYVIIVMEASPQRLEKLAQFKLLLGLAWP